METRTINLNLDQAKLLLKATPDMQDVIFANFPELKPKPLVLDKWEDLEKIRGYYISADSEIEYVINQEARGDSRNIFATKKQAESSLTYAQLTQLMAHTGDCDVDWSNEDQPKYTIIRSFDSIGKDSTYVNFEKLAFKQYRIRDEFFEKHIELIKTYYEL